MGLLQEHDVRSPKTADHSERPPGMRMAKMRRKTWNQILDPCSQTIQETRYCRLHAPTLINLLGLEVLGPCQMPTEQFAQVVLHVSFIDALLPGILHGRHGLELLACGFLVCCCTCAYSLDSMAYAYLLESLNIRSPDAYIDLSTDCNSLIVGIPMADPTMAGRHHLWLLKTRDGQCCAREENTSHEHMVAPVETKAPLKSYNQPFCVDSPAFPF